MRVGFNNSGFEQDGYRYMTKGAFLEGGVPKVRVELFKQNGDGDYERIGTFYIPRNRTQSSMMTETIVRLVDERRAARAVAR